MLFEWGLSRILEEFPALTPQRALRDLTSGAVQEPPTWLYEEMLALRAFARTYEALEAAKRRKDDDEQSRLYSTFWGRAVLEAEARAAGYMLPEE